MAKYLNVSFKQENKNWHELVNNCINYCDTVFIFGVIIVYELGEDERFEGRVRGEPFPQILNYFGFDGVIQIFF